MSKSETCIKHHHITSDVSVAWRLADAAKTRMTLVKLIAMRILAELKVKADGAYKDMNDWLGARFLKEMERFVGTVKEYWYR